LGAWSLPGGAQKFGETAEAAARRELLEETGVEAGPLYLAAVVDSIHRDERGAVAYHYTIVDYCARWEAGEARSGGDVTEARFVELDELYGFGLEKEAVRVIGRAKDVFLKNGKKTF
jgi:ADP-ribose pyrophosphatase YjhB (NUDIX family)